MSEQNEAQPNPEASMCMVCPSCNRTFESGVWVCPDDGSGLLEVPNTPLLTGKVLDDRYEIGSVVGTGGMGVVYKAFQPAMERDVAVKVLHPKYTHDPRAVKRFFREAQAASRLIDPNVVTVYDFGRSSKGHLYMVMELLEGWTLGDLIHHRAPLVPRTALALAVQVCAALDAAHKRRIVHRDLKPDNIQLISRDGRIRAKVLDFGIARVLHDPDSELAFHLSTIDIAGTPAYMSPEQIMGKDPDPRSDLYSLGVIIFEMLTGERPFDDDHSVTLCMKQLNEEPPELKSFIDSKELPDDVSALVSELLAKDVNDRPASAIITRERLLKTGIADQRLPKGWLSEIGEKVSGKTLPTRPDFGATMALVTLDSLGAHAALAAESLNLSTVLAKTPGISLLNAESTKSQPMKGRSAGTAKMTEPDNGAKSLNIHGIQSQTVALAVLNLASATSSESLDFDLWCIARQREGWEIARMDQRILLSVPKHGGLSAKEASRVLLDRVQLLQVLARTANLGLSIGLSDAETLGSPDHRPIAAVVTRLATIAPPGSIALPADLARSLGLEGRQAPSVQNTSGQNLVSWILDAPSNASVPTTPFVGRTRELRELGALADRARRKGPVIALVQGKAGVGKSALLHEYARGRAHIYIRSASAAHVWPGHTLARLALCCLGMPAESEPQNISQRIEHLPSHIRERLSVLLLDEDPVEPIAVQGLASTLVELLSWRAGEDPYSVIFDDVQFEGEPGLQLLNELAQAAEARPWLFLASGDPSVAGANLTSIRAEQVIELRPMGLREATTVTRTYGVPSQRRHGVLSAAAGNPLALRLCAEQAVNSPLPRQGTVVSKLLPVHIQCAESQDAKRAWLSAVSGGMEIEADHATRAAKLYLRSGLNDAIRSWLHTQLGQAGFYAAQLAPYFDPPLGLKERTAKRLERLGLYRYAAEQVAEIAPHEAPNLAVFLRFEAARLLAEAGDLEAAIDQYDLALDLAPVTVNIDPNSLLNLAYVLLEAEENERGEDILLKARARLAREGSARLHGRLSALLARAAVRRNDITSAMGHLGRSREALELLRPTEAREGRKLEALIQQVRAEIALAEGDTQGTRTNLQQARDAFRDLGYTTEAIRCLLQLGQLELDLGHAEVAADTFRAVCGLSVSSGLPNEEHLARIGLGQAMVQTGHVDKGIGLLRRVFREVGIEPREQRLLCRAATALASTMHARELFADAQRYGNLALNACNGNIPRCRALLVLGKAEIALNHGAQGRRLLEEALEAAIAGAHGLLKRIIKSELSDEAATTPEKKYSHATAS